MLEDLPRSPKDHCLTLTGLPGSALPFFQALLAEWGYDVEHRADGFMLVKAGHRRARGIPPCTSLEVAAPLDLPTLWSRIESRFHATPRRHIRLKCDITAELSFAGLQQEGRFISFSDAGGRLNVSEELVRGEVGTVRFSLKGRTFVTPCEVIYALPKREWKKTPGTESGVVFRWPDPAELQRARQLIVHCYLDRVAATLSGEEYRAGLELVEGMESDKGPDTA